MKYIAKLFIILSIIAAPLYMVSSASAVDVFQNTCKSAQGQKTTVCKDVAVNATKGNPVVNILITAISIFSAVLGAVAVIIIIISGLRFVTSHGDAQGVQTAKSSIIYALVGLAVAILAQSVVVFVLKKI